MSQSLPSATSPTTYAPPFSFKSLLNRCYFTAVGLLHLTVPCRLLIQLFHLFSTFLTLKSPSTAIKFDTWHSSLDILTPATSTKLVSFPLSQSNSTKRSKIIRSLLSYQSTRLRKLSPSILLLLSPVAAKWLDLSHTASIAKRYDWLFPIWECERRVCPERRPIRSREHRKVRDDFAEELRNLRHDQEPSYGE